MGDRRGDWFSLDEDGWRGLMTDIQEATFEAFRKWLGKWRGTVYAKVDEPDKLERKRPEIDYVLADSETCDEVAVEVSSIWLSSAAGKENSDWSTLTTCARPLLRGKLPGRFYVYTEPRTPFVSPQTFATELEKLIVNEGANLSTISISQEFQLCGMRIFVAKYDAEGSGVVFGRRFEASDTDRCCQFIQTILANRSPKLRAHKGCGRETWLVLYNTAWPLLQLPYVRELINQQLCPDHSHIDHIAVVAGDPPEEAWVDVVR